MLEFFTDNPVLALIIIFIVVRLLTAGKSKKPHASVAPKEEPRPVLRGETARTARLTDLKAALRDAMREADRQFMTGDRPATAGSEPDAEPAPAAAPEPAGDPFAFRSLMNREEKPGGVARIDYDTTATDYDARSDAFAFRSASREPLSQEYHLGGFQAFKRAGGLSTDTVQVKAVGEDVAVRGETDPYALAMADPDTLRRAVILQEILERPLALRRRR